MNNRRYNPVATVVVCVVALAVGFALLYSPRFHRETVEAPVTTATSTIEGPTMKESEPTRLVIPSVNINTTFSEPLELEETGEIEVPDDYVSVGYYKFGPTPGEIGPAVVLGHVDSFEGPAVLYSLGNIEEGDEIKIERKDGTIATFAVTEIERNSQNDFPTQKVYGKIPFAGLRLITCSGVYDKNTLRYSHNLIVYGKLVATSTKSGT